MRYSGIQPQYFPRLHYFARSLKTDIFVLRDEVQFVLRHKYPDGKNGPSYQTHTPIKTSTGLYLLNIPTSHQGYKPINQTSIIYGHLWIHKHIKTIATNYAKSPNFSKYFPDIQQILGKKYEILSHLNTLTFLWGINIFLGTPLKLNELSIKNINRELKQNKKFRLKKIVLASKIRQLNNTSLSANEKILTIIKALKAAEDYTGGTAFAAYMDEGLFEKNNIKVTIQDWKCQAYPQLFSSKLGFLPNLSIIDLLMNASLKQATDIING